MEWTIQQKAIAFFCLAVINIVWIFLFLIGGLFVKAITFMVLLVSIPGSVYILTL